MARKLSDKPDGEIQCENCNGSGEFDCGECEGSGTHLRECEYGYEHEMDCSDCDASGHCDCPDCGGSGWVPDPDPEVDKGL